VPAEPGQRVDDFIGGDRRLRQRRFDPEMPKP
jgi:hypothetical protein